MKKVFYVLCTKKARQFLSGLIVLFLLANCSFATTINGRIVIQNQNDRSDILSIKLQVNSDTGTDDMGGATMIISFDTTQLSFASEPAEGEDFLLHNFGEGNYIPVKITKVLGNQVWINIHLIKNDEGVVVSGNEGWTDVATLYFKKAANEINDAVKWEVESPFWSVFDGDNATLWSTGNFEVLAGNGEENTLPEEFVLNQNYPNPFNPFTIIEFNILQNENVKLVVFNAIGEEVAVLINERMERGLHKINFDASHLASGMYLYELTAGKFSSVKKMILIK